MGERQPVRRGAGHDVLTAVSRARIRLGRHTVTAAEILEGPWGEHIDMFGVRAGWDANRAVTALYSQHYSALVRLASLLLRDTASAEDVVQDSFVALHASWRGLRDSDRALCYLRQAVLSRSRAARRRCVVPGRNAGELATGRPGEQPPMAGPGSSAVIVALQALPPQQREALVMRYYADLSGGEIAEIMGISERAVRQHAARAMASLHAALDAAGGTTPPGLLVAR